MTRNLPIAILLTAFLCSLFLVVAPAAPSALASSCSPPEITSLSTITTNTAGTITINGCGFGTSPQLVTNFIAGDGSVDTVESSTTPQIAIIDGLVGCCGWTQWEAGFAINPGTIDSIGIYIVSWTDSQIVINGFGNQLGTGHAPFNIAAGDTITIIVVGPNCAAATYDFPPFPASCSASYTTTVQGASTSVPEFPMGLPALLLVAILVAMVLRTKSSRATLR